MDIEKFECSDLNLAAFLKAKHNLEIIDIARQLNSNRASFIFKVPSNLDINSEVAGNMPCLAKQLLDISGFQLYCDILPIFWHKKGLTGSGPQIYFSLSLFVFCLFLIRS